MRKRGFLERRWRLLLAGAVWIGGGFAAHAAGLKPGASSLVGWNLACLAYLVPTLWTIVKADADSVKRTACEEDESRAVIPALVLTAVASSFASVIIALREGKQAHGGSDWLVVMAISTIVLSWFVVQSVFTLHYAHKYFGDGERRRPERPRHQVSPAIRPRPTRTSGTSPCVWARPSRFRTSA